MEYFASLPLSIIKYQRYSAFQRMSKNLEIYFRYCRGLSWQCGERPMFQRATAYELSNVNEVGFFRSLNIPSSDSTCFYLKLHILKPKTVALPLLVQIVLVLLKLNWGINLSDVSLANILRRLLNNRDIIGIITQRTGKLYIQISKQEMTKFSNVSALFWLQLITIMFIEH